MNSAAHDAGEEAASCSDARVDAGILRIGTAQARGDHAAEFIVVDGTAARVAAAGILAPGVGTEGSGWHRHLAGIHTLADILADQLEQHSAQLRRGVAVAIASDAPAGDTHVVAGAPLYTAQWYSGNAAARHGALQAQHSDVHIHLARSVRTGYVVARNATHYTGLAEFGDTALHSKATRCDLVHTVGRSDHIDRSMQRSSAYLFTIIA